MSGLWKTLKVFSAFICIGALAFIIIFNTIFALMPDDMSEIFIYGLDARIDLTSVTATFVISLVLHLFFLVLERMTDGERSVLKLVGAVIVRASIFALVYFAGGKLFAYVVESMSGKSAAELEDALWTVFAPMLAIFALLIFGFVVGAAAKKRDSQATYYSGYTSTAQSTTKSSTAACASATSNVKRFSKNAWEERQGTRYVLVNCFYDNYGSFYTIDEGNFYGALERFSNENQQRYYGNASLKTYRDGVIYGSDGKHGYRGSNDWLRDGRCYTFVVKR